jgi:hypothetical protein
MSFLWQKFAILVLKKGLEATWSTKLFKTLP